jgi:hypothetical protein
MENSEIFNFINTYAAKLSDGLIKFRKTMVCIHFSSD